jgi:hypothetical protein|nr:hypothetical protein [Neorhizobium tomejilense]
MNRYDIENWAVANSFIPTAMPSQYVRECNGARVVLEIKRASLVVITSLPGLAPTIATRLFKDADNLLYRNFVGLTGK